MLPVQERLHIDELKRVEKQANVLLKKWRRLNKDYRQLLDRHEKLATKSAEMSEVHQQQVQQFQEDKKGALADLTQDWQTRFNESDEIWAKKLEDNEVNWQQRYDTLKASSTEDLATLKSEHEQQLQALKDDYEARISELEQSLTILEKQHNVLVERIRGVSGE